ncbi:hypothetical protein CW745_11235 [Psychromonas sp. psych-6C06]|uniref:DUF7305 domain-containing protein n=1 Tax=Psychromonas sp. psych-6C06 TaxID=2058089 RepID=UPI000C323782|nr:polymer-forming cytoskeletal protein [Psychromonas sp. psych-6C06]PKF61199.1 hypothetical protein CW745_11235 [Psychromonas sp. psych-6C06]
MKKSQNGFVLISVLLITSIATFYAFSEIKGNQLQERIGGNQQKEMNARLLAEKGIFESFKYIQVAMSNSVDTNDMINALNNGNTGYINHEEGLITILDASEHADIFTFKSKGTIHGAEALMIAEIDASEIIPPSPFKDAIVGCEGVGLYNGVVDSYNSADNPGAYDENNAGNNGGIATVNSDADVTLNAGTVKGNIDSNGSIGTTPGGSGANVTGNLTAQKNITTKEATITGNVNARESAHITGGHIEGTLNSGRNLTHTGSPIVDGNVSYGGDLLVQSGGADPTPSTYDFGHNNVSGVAEKTPPASKQSCDPKGISAVVRAIDENTNKPTAVAAVSGPSGGTMKLTDSVIDADGRTGEVFTRDSDNNLVTTPVYTSEMNLTALDSKELAINEKVYVLESLELVNTQLEIKGDVTLIVEGDISLFGGQSGFKFASGAESTSSLTIVSKGKVTIGSDATIFPNASKVHNGSRAPLSIYSSYDSSGTRADSYNSGSGGTEQNVDAAFVFAGDSAMYAKIYAPLGYVSVNGSGKLMGSVRGKAVDVRGTGGVHYDEALGLPERGDPPDPSKVKYLSAYYYYN